MPQRFSVDRAGLALYLGLVAAGCAPAYPRLVPAGAEPVPPQQVAGWVEPTRPTGRQLLRFQWQYQDERAAAGGHGSARIAAPDSLRFDVAGPFGAGAGAAMVVGDSAVWTNPADILSRMVPSYPLLWGLFGVARPPAPGSELSGLASGDQTAWQYVDGADTVSYVRTTGSAPRLVTEVRQGGQLIGRAETTLKSDGTPAKARLALPSIPARLDITFVSSTRPPHFGPEVWTAR